MEPGTLGSDRDAKRRRWHGRDVATAYVGTYSTIVQDFTDDTTNSRVATATFDLERGLLAFDRYMMCHISFNVGVRLP